MNPFDEIKEDNDYMKYRIDHETGNYIFESTSYNDMYRLSISIGKKGEISKNLDNDSYRLICKTDKHKEKARLLFYENK